MAGTNRWLALVLVGLLALLAQPAAVVDTPAVATSSDRPAMDADCEPVTDLDASLAEELVDVDVRTPELDACVAIAEDPLGVALEQPVDVVLR